MTRNQQMTLSHARSMVQEAMIVVRDLSEDVDNEKTATQLYAIFMTLEGTAADIGDIVHAVE